jgi:hypothetical protein
LIVVTIACTRIPAEAARPSDVTQAPFTASASSASRPLPSAASQAPAPSTAIPVANAQANVSGSRAGDWGAPPSEVHPASVVNGACRFDPDAPIAGKAEGWFVLLSDGSRVVQTEWVERGPDGPRVIGAVSAPVLSFQGGVYLAKQEHSEVATQGCEDLVPGSKGSSRVEHLVLERLDAEGRIEPTGPEQPTEVPDGQRETFVSGLLGANLFVRAEDYSYACGAHGGLAIEVRSIALDGKVSAKVTVPPAVKAEAKEQLRAYYAANDIDYPLQVHFETALPEYVEGVLRTSFVFTGATDYADSSWSSYQHAVFVDGAAPAAWSRWRRLPDLASALICEAEVDADAPQSSGKLKLAGFSLAPQEKDAPAKLVALFHK